VIPERQTTIFRNIASAKQRALFNGWSEDGSVAKGVDGAKTYVSSVPDATVTGEGRTSIAARLLREPFTLSALP
jgi:hypothetical protein